MVRMHHPRQYHVVLMMNENVVWWLKTDWPNTTLTGEIPHFVNSTGGMLRSSRVEEMHAITWTSKKKQGFELPTGGAALMHEGANLMYFARKEQCLALGRQLRKMKPSIKDYKVYRIYPQQEPVLVHPANGTFPEKVTEDRVAVNTNMRAVGDNPSPHTVKFTDKNTFD